MLMNPRGYHAFLLVVKFGARFTTEDQDTVAFLKKLFGQEFVKQYCILIMTYGDLFERESEENGQTFEQWCNCQQGVFRELLQECCNRVVLFDNLTKDETKRDAQIDRLLETISHLQFHGHRYTDRNFEQAAVIREKALVESKRPVITEEILQEVSLILQKLNEERIDLNYDKPVTPLQNLSARCDELVKSVKEQDRNTGALQDLEEKVKSLKKSVDDAILVHRTAKEERKKLAEKEASMIEQMEIEMQIRRQQMNEIKEEMNESIEKQRRHYEDMIAMSNRDREEMQREFERNRSEIENESRMRLQRAEADLESQRVRNDQQVALERSAHATQMEQILAAARQDIQYQAGHLDQTYKNSRQISAAGVMMNGLGYVAFAAGHIIAPEVMAVLWIGASMYAAYHNK